MIDESDLPTIIEITPCHRADLFVSADVVILNNVFEFFVSEEGGAREGMWTFLRTAMRPGTLIVSSPAIEKSLSTINVRTK